MYIAGNGSATSDGGLSLDHGRRTPAASARSVSQAGARTRDPDPPMRAPVEATYGGTRPTHVPERADNPRKTWWTRTQRIRTVATLPLEMAMLEAMAAPLYESVVNMISARPIATETATQAPHGFTNNLDPAARTRHRCVEPIFDSRATRGERRTKQRPS
jgi:hypothetical protein